MKTIGSLVFKVRNASDNDPSPPPLRIPIMYIVSYQKFVHDDVSHQRILEKIVDSVFLLLFSVCSYFYHVDA